MKNLTALSLKIVEQQLYVLDQTLLPQQQQWLHCTTVPQMVSLIKNLQLRGAPAIGIGAVLLLAYRALQGDSREQLLQDAAVLRAARPTAVNLMNNLDTMLAALAQPPVGRASASADEAQVPQKVR